MADGQAADDRDAGPSSAAERLMRQHGSPQAPTDPSAGPPHLSYAERKAADFAEQSQASSSSANGTREARPSEPDFGSESAFPSLGAPAVAPKQTAAWGSGPAVSARLAAAPPKKAPAAARGQPARPTPAASGPTYTEPLALDAKRCVPTPQK